MDKITYKQFINLPQLHLEQDHLNILFDPSLKKLQSFNFQIDTSNETRTSLLDMIENELYHEIT